MKFSTMIIYVNEEFPDKSIFDDLKNSGSSRFEKNKFFYSIEQDLFDEKYYWMYFQYDNQVLYSDTVVNTESYEQTVNTRPKHQLELRNQLFVCFDIEQKIMYISDYSKKHVVSDYIDHSLGKKVEIKNIYKSIEEFLNVAKYLKSVTFTQSRNLINSTPDSIFSQVGNIYGLDLPEKSKIKLEYANSSINKIKPIMQEWQLKRNRSEFEDVVIIGTDDDGFEHSFNYSTLVDSLNLDVRKDENDRYNPTVIRNLLMEKLRS